MRAFFPIICSIILAACGQVVDTAVAVKKAEVVSPAPEVKASSAVTPATSDVAPVQPTTTVIIIAGSVRTWGDYEKVKAEAWKQYETAKNKAWVEYDRLEKAELAKLKSLNEKAYYQLLESERLRDMSFAQLENESPEVKTYNKATTEAWKQYKAADDAGYRAYKAADAAAYQAFRKAEKKKKL